MRPAPKARLCGALGKFHSLASNTIPKRWKLIKPFRLKRSIYLPQQQFNALNDESLHGLQHLIVNNSEPLAQNEYRFYAAKFHYRNNELSAAMDSLNVIVR